MKRLSLTLLASVAVVVTAGSVFGQNSNNYVGYETSDWSQFNNCQNDHHRGGRGQGNGSALTRCVTSKAYPDSGWAPPVNYPVNYDGAWYGNYNPQVPYGSPGGGFIGNYPTVYQPNDTTQLGYTYMKVPTWQTRTDMIPPVPNPGNFHTRGCVGGHGCLHSGMHGGHGNSCPNCNSGHVVHNYHSQHGMHNMQPMHNMHAMQMQPAPMQPNTQTVYSSPDGQKVVRPVAHTGSVFSKMRFASLTELFD